MTGTGFWRGMALVAACMGAALAAPAAAAAAKVPALSTHSASTSTPGSNHELVATATCGAKEHVVSGGFNGTVPTALVLDDAVGRNGWTVGGYVTGPATLTAYAYCAHNGQIAVSNHDATVTAGPTPTNTTATSSCDSGETLVSGGFAFIDATSTEANSTTFRDYSPRPSKWTVMSAFSTQPAQLEAFAYCGRGLTITTRPSKTASVVLDGTGTAKASCRKGETLLGGGFTTTPTPDYNNTSGPDTYFSASYRSSKQSWTASATNFSVVAGTITAFAYCAS